MKTASGYEVVNVDPKIASYMKENFEGFAKFGITKVVPGDFYSTDWLPIKIDGMYHLKLRSRDVFICSYLKVGSTWMTEIVWALLNNPNLDHPMQNEDTPMKGPWIDCAVTLAEDQIPLAVAKTIPPGKTFFDILSNLPDHRIFHTHLPFDMLPKGIMDKTKSVYVIRDPRDVCLSYYHYTSNVQFLGYKKSLDTFVDDYVNGMVFCGHYIDHLRQWWPKRNHANVYTVFFEDVRRNPKIEITKLTEFLGVKLNDKQIENVVHYTSLEEMKKRDAMATNQEATKQFLKSSDKSGKLRKGEIGSSKSGMTAEMNEKIAKYFRENLGEIKLPYDLTK